MDSLVNREYSDLAFIKLLSKFVYRAADEIDEDFHLMILI